MKVRSKNRVSLLCLIAGTILVLSSCEDYYREAQNAVSAENKRTASKQQKEFEYLEKQADFRFKTKSSLETKRYIDKVTAHFGGVIKATQINPQELKSNTIELANDSIKILREEKLLISQSLAIPSPYFDLFLDSLVTRISRPELLEVHTTDRSYEVLKNKLYAQAPIPPAMDSNFVKQERQLKAYDVNKKVEFSIINITYYEDSRIRTEVLPNIPKMMNAETAFGVQASEAFAKSITGVERFLLFLIRNWITISVLTAIGIIIFKLRKRITSSRQLTYPPQVN